MKTFRRGFSLAEIMVSIAIMLLIVGISSYVFQNTNKKQSLEKAVTNVVSVINSVRSLAVSSKEFCSYGLNISTTTNSITSFVVLPDSNCFAGSFSTTTLLLNNFGTIISSSTVSGGQIIFQKVNGNTTNTGSFILQLKNDSNSSTTITIYSIGILETK